MKKAFFSSMVTLLALSACASPTSVVTTQPSFPDQVMTMVAATMQALPTNTPVPEPPAELLPHTLYYLGRNANTGTAEVFQVFRMERDGETRTQLTSEPNGVDGYDISPADGTITFVADNQLLLVNADGSNRRLLVDGGSARQDNDPRSFKDPLLNPVFSPDGQTIAYSHRGLDMYEISTGASTLVLQGEVYGSPKYYSPVSYSPDGKKLLIEMQQWEVPNATAVYYPDTNALVKIEEPHSGLICCSGPVWSSDGSSFYGVAVPANFCCQAGELWKVDAGNGVATRLLTITFGSGETYYSPTELHLAPDGQLYYFFGAYQVDSGYWNAPVLNMMRSAPDGVTDRIILRDENFVLMNEALWAPDASFVIISMTPSRYLNQDQGGGVLELYYTDAHKSVVWLAPSGYQMKWEP